MPTGKGLYRTSAFFASAKTLASLLCACLWSLFQKEGKKEEDTDLGHRGCEGLLKTRWQDSKIWCPYTAARLSFLQYMWQAVVEWVMLLCYGRSVNSSLPLSKFPSPFLWESLLKYTTVLFLEGFIIVLFREDFLLRNYLNSFFWYLPCFVEQDS